MNQQVINKLKDYENNLIETDRRNNLINLKEICNLLKLYIRQLIQYIIN